MAGAQDRGQAPRQQRAAVNAPGFTELERPIVDEIKRIGGFVSDDDACAYALWFAATHLGIDVPRGVFDLPWTPKMRKLLLAERGSK